MDTEVHPELINARFAYVSVSRASQDAQVFTNDAANLTESLSKEVSKTSAINIGNETGFPNSSSSRTQAQAPAVTFGLHLSR
jgi:hypothetical protein